jgi:hypothetical protein
MLICDATTSKPTCQAKASCTWDNSDRYCGTDVEAVLAKSPLAAYAGADVYDDCKRGSISSSWCPFFASLEDIVLKCANTNTKAGCVAMETCNWDTFDNCVTDPLQSGMAAMRLTGNMGMYAQLMLANSCMQLTTQEACLAKRMPDGSTWSGSGSSAKSSSGTALPALLLALQLAFLAMFAARC